ncbi:ATP-binding protein [Deinococcus peraridilitoris]|nr:AAA family ATPase [Deinococcus peraridilitoris]
MPHVRMLGRFRVVDGERVIAPPRSNTVLLLAYLACRADWADRGRLATLFWPDQDEEVALTNLRQVLARARAHAWAANVEAERTRVRWLVPNDVQAFRDALGRGDAASAVEGYHGEFLDGMDALPDGLQEWVDAERETLRSAWLRVSTRRAADLEANGNMSGAAELAGRILETDALAEDALQTFMRCAAGLGRRDDALRAYRSFRERLDRELRLEPLAGTRELAEQIGRGELPVARVPARQPTATMEASRLVGRDADLARLRASTAPALIIMGDPGIGKTRFLQALAPDAPWLRCREGLERVPYLALLDLLRARAADLPDLGPYREDLARLAPDLAPDLASGLTPALLDPETARTRVVEALTRCLETVASGSPFGLVVDDLQWVDPYTLEVLAYGLSGRRVRVLGACRTLEGPEGLSSLVSAGAETHTLAPLSEDDVRALLATLMETAQGPPVFTRWLHQRTGGNPFFALETLRFLAETGVLHVEPGGWRTEVDDVTRDYRELSVPPRVAQSVLRRVKALPEEARRVLDVACVLSTGLDPTLLSGIVGLSDWAVMEALDAAERAGITRGDAFAHDLFRQTLYASLPEARRAFTHTRIARELAARQATPLVVAEHFIRAAQPEAAAHQLLNAARLAEDTSRRDVAAELYARAAELLELAGRADEAVDATVAEHRMLAEFDTGPRADALVERLKRLARTPLQLGWAAHAEAHLAYVRADAARAEQTSRRGLEFLALHGTDASLEGSLCAVLASSLWAQGRVAEALPVTERRAGSTRASGDLRELESALNDLGVISSNLERHREAITYLQQSLDITTGPVDPVGRVSTLNNLAVSQGELGRTRDSLETLLRAQALLEPTSGTEALRIQHDTAVGLRLHELGEYGGALDAYARAERLARDLQFWSLPTVLRSIAGVYVDLGELELAQQYLDEALARPNVRPLQRCAILRVQGKLDLIQGRNPDPALDEAEEIAGRVGKPKGIVLAQLDRAVTRAPDEAFDLARQALKDARSLDLPGVEALAHLRAAQAAIALGRFVEAAEAARTCIAMSGTYASGATPAETHLTLHRALWGVGDRRAFEALRAAGEWIRETVARHVPPAHVQAFLKRNPVNVAVALASEQAED